MNGDLSSAITDHIAALLLRYFRAAIAADATVRRIDVERDRELLRLQWSLSTTVAVFADYILAHRHETQSFLATRERADPAVVRGRIDARRTLITRLASGDSSIVIAHEPIRSFDSGPNQVTAWVLQQAWMLATRFRAMLPAEATYRGLAEASAARLDRVRKIESITAAMAEVDLVRGPGPAALRAAARSRRRTYRLAYEAYTALAAIEAGDPAAIETLLRDTLVAPLETWRRFELATALALAEALSRATAMPMRLDVLAGDTRRPVATVGRFAIYWQSRTSWYADPDPEPSELIAREMLAQYNLKPDSDRPDLIVADHENDAVVAVIEVKFFTAAAEDALGRLREATHQVVRYARGYRSLEAIRPLLARSAIVLVRRPDLPPAESAPVVLAFSDMLDGAQFDRWAAALV
jgi:hypothetical protein